MKKYIIIGLISIIFHVTGCSLGNDTSEPLDGIELTKNDEANSILDIVWEIENYTTESGEIVAVAEQTKYQFLFESQTSNLKAFIGCVMFMGSVYELNDGYIKFTLGGRDQVVCLNETAEFSQQNNAISSLLYGGDSAGSVPLMYTVSGDELLLEAAGGRKLELVAVDEMLKQ